MIKRTVNIDAQQKEAIEKLMAICEQTDGVAPVLQMEHTLNAHEAMNGWFLAYEDQTLIGVASVFQVRFDEAEVSGCVHPLYRRKGVFTQLSQEALREIAHFGATRILWINNRKSLLGSTHLEHRGYTLFQTEYAMTYEANPHLVKPSEMLQIRRAEMKDVEALAQVNAAGFLESEEQARSIALKMLSDPSRENYFAEVEGEIVGSVSIAIGDQEAMINALSIQSNLQGKGLGRLFMQRLLQLLDSRGLKIILDVNSENQRAYTLYQSLGFTETMSTDYWVGCE